MKRKNGKKWKKRGKNERKKSITYDRVVFNRQKRKNSTNSEIMRIEMKH